MAPLRYTASKHGAHVATWPGPCRAHGESHEAPADSVSLTTGVATCACGNVYTPSELRRPPGDARDVPPALTPDEWRAREHHSGGIGGVSLASSDFGLRVIQSGPIAGVSDLAALIALANTALNDEDPRKFTHDTVRVLRQIPAFLHGAAMGDDPDGAAHFVRDLADVIESYLPPRTLTDRKPL